MDHDGSPTPPSSTPISVQNPKVTGESTKEGVEAGEKQMIQPVAVSLAAAADVGEETDVQKKLRRAERFGMPVMLSEGEKRNTRAHRFGMGSTLHQTTSTGQLEDQKRKARAERFGLATHSTADEEAKKKARLARFGQTPKIDSLEEEKRKARAARFGEASTTSSQENGKDEFEKKAATVTSTV